MPKERFVPDRYESAIRMERARQIIRECNKYGFTVTGRMMAELNQAEDDYELATSVL